MRAESTFEKFRCLLALWVSLCALVLAGPAATAAGAASPRERLLLDAGWKFHLGDDWGLGERLDKAGESSGPAKMNFNDLGWRTLNLPHDWAVELPFDSSANYDHGYKPLGPGFATNNVGWYRRTFNLTEADRDKRLGLEFDGVYRDCRVFLNGYELARHESGYNSFRCDITDVADCVGKNVLAVRVDASQFEGWYYEGAGIYRHVWLEKTSRLAISPDSLFVFSSFKNNQPKGAATLHLKLQLVNAQTGSTQAQVAWQVFDPDGHIVATETRRAQAVFAAETEVEAMTKVSAPVLWSPQSPKLYRLVATVESCGRLVDRMETEFGIRTLAFDTTNGFLLNGKRYAIKGTCNHQDHAGVGLALPDALQNFRVARLKTMGCNAIRTSHNEPATELLDACDHLGMLVMDENRRLGSDPENLTCLRQQICRDRNHPSVFIWSLANEEHSVQRAAVGARVFGTMQNLAHELDPSRPCTAAMDGRSEEKADGFSAVMDVQGFNYIHRGDLDAFHKSNPTIPCIGTEESSSYYTRGIYRDTKSYRSAYDDNKPDYGTTAEEWWTYYSARPWASGSFVWTGFDYRGEASPFHWPNISSEFGILDACGCPKDVFYYYQSWWTDQPVLHLMPHWNWPGKEGQAIDVRCFSNCEDVELFLNGRSLGKRRMPKLSHLQWPVSYAPGTLSAKGYRDGKLAAETEVKTTGAPAAVKLTPDRYRIIADDRDVSVVTVSVTDAQGQVVPVADNQIHFELRGPGRIIGVGNGDPICHEADVSLTQYPVHRVALSEGWRWKAIPKIVLDPEPEFGTNYNDSSWESADVQSNHGQLQEHTQAIFRAKFQVGDIDLTADGVALVFELIDDDGYIFVNGRQVGEAHVAHMPAVFDVKPFLHPGENTIAVGVVNDGGPGGISEGVALEYRFTPVPANWQRSAFNGLAQVLVQSTKQAGEVKITATAAGLPPADITIESTQGKL